MWNDQIYSVGFWDAAIAIFARKSILEKHGIRIPTLDEPWTGDEFDAALVTLKESGEFEYPLNLGMADKGEWYPYAFCPILQSFGGDIVDRETYQTAEGVLNGDAAIEFGEWWQSLFERELAPGTSQDPADRQNGFVDGKYALNWTGNWMALPALEKFGDDMLFLPAPTSATAPKIGAASWQFGVSATERAPGRGQRLHRVRAAGQVLRRLLRRHRADPADPRGGGDEQVLHRGRADGGLLRALREAGRCCGR